ncbi:hypothetical protein AKO1_013612, partial [Acrasis kona]
SLVLLLVCDKKKLGECNVTIKKAILDLLLACLEQHWIPSSCRLVAAKALKNLVRAVSDQKDFIQTDRLFGLIKVAGDYRVQSTLRKIALGLDPNATILNVPLSEDTSLDHINALIRGAATILKLNNWVFGWDGILFLKSGNFVSYSELKEITVSNDSVTIKTHNKNLFELDKLSMHDIVALKNFTPVLLEFGWSVEKNGSLVELVDSFGIKLRELFHRVHEQLDAGVGGKIKSVTIVTTKNRYYRSNTIKRPSESSECHNCDTQSDRTLEHVLWERESKEQVANREDDLETCLQY